MDATCDEENQSNEAVTVLYLHYQLIIAVVWWRPIVDIIVEVEERDVAQARAVIIVLEVGDQLQDGVRQARDSPFSHQVIIALIKGRVAACEDFVSKFSFSASKDTRVQIGAGAVVSFTHVLINVVELHTPHSHPNLLYHLWPIWKASLTIGC
eukprot:CAMPEP_0170546800 /NCGR_PEP_ID=MMETSP0211-20121228/5139_1 /TAXON_ID=311385 /ORGANISM="Pseudokeronopsis sp., Strain OXSARD2" /LENGTH=152 /DNA_ID=CAMNT_0010851443 /DNA_START=24 /DNA_END=482 /DNA_ORIENTATION=+